MVLEGVPHELRLNLLNRLGEKFSQELKSDIQAV